MNEKQIILLKQITKEAKDKNCFKLIYEWEWTYLLPSHSLYIDDIDLMKNLGGWNGIGTIDLEVLVSLGYLMKIKEIELACHTYKKIEYQINI